MNEKAFGLPQMLAICLFVTLCLIASMITYQKYFHADQLKSSQYDPKPAIVADKKEDQKVINKEEYEKLEEQLKIAAKQYVAGLDQIESSMIISLDTLIEKKYQEKIKDPNNPKVVCDGYVIYKRSNDTYKSYLHCQGSYATENYNPELE